MVKTHLIIKNPSQPFKAGEALKIGSYVHLTLRNKAFYSGKVRNYCADGGYLEYLVIQQDKGKRILVRGADIDDIEVLPFGEEKEAANASNKKEKKRR